MKTPVFKDFGSKILSILLIPIAVHSCTTYNKIYAENDIVYHAKRFELKYYVNDRDRRSPLYDFTQSIVKEINPNNEVSYTAYDVLSLSDKSFKLDEKVFLIIDNKVYPMAVDKIELENVKSISENTTDISTADSTKVAVTTGYSENNKKIARFSYKIPLATMEKIKGSNQFSIRYYAGPDMITVKPKKKSIKKIKQLTDNT